ncbi:MAG TPA: maltotransferase domain-containing protein, partial [Jatrophihabitantaceae bacterium]|nr:maltotransferase domain-containing protein [Jatrophihabitantaceae bacterium]
MSRATARDGSAPPPVRTASRPPPTARASPGRPASQVQRRGVSRYGGPVVGRLGLNDISPVVASGTLPAAAVAGERIPVSATVFREGHDAVAANVALRG